MTGLRTPSTPADPLPERDVVRPVITTASLQDRSDQSGQPGVTVIGLIAASMVGISVVAVPGPLGFLGGGLALLMLAIAVIDARRFIIPDGLSVAALVLALAHAAVQAPDAIVPAALHALIRAVALALVLLIFRSAYAYLRGRQGLGLGDVKLAGV